MCHRNVWLNHLEFWHAIFSHWNLYYNLELVYSFTHFSMFFWFFEKWRVPFPTHFLCELGHEFLPRWWSDNYYSTEGAMADPCPSLSTTDNWSTPNTLMSILKKTMIMIRVTVSSAELPIFLVPCTSGDCSNCRWYGGRVVWVILLVGGTEWLFG